MDTLLTYLSTEDFQTSPEEMEAISTTHKLKVFVDSFLELDKPKARVSFESVWGLIRVLIVG